MHKGRHTFRKPDTLLLLAVFVGLAVVVTTAADAARDATRFPALADLQDGDVQVVRMGRHGPGVHLTLQSPSGGPDVPAAGVAEQSATSTAPDVFLKLRWPW
jgi:hypothetical protein